MSGSAIALAVSSLSFTAEERVRFQARPSRISSGQIGTERGFFLVLGFPSSPSLQICYTHIFCHRLHINLATCIVYNALKPVG